MRKTAFIRVARALRFRRGWIVAATVALATAAGAAVLPNLMPFRDAAGIVETFSTAGHFDETGPFFQSLGTNGRACSTCHVVENGMGLSGAHAEDVFRRTGGHDPLFAPVDGAVCPTAAPGHPLDFSLLRHYGLLRIGMDMPSNPQFTITAVSDPYGCALVTNPQTGVTTISVYRRPLVAANLKFQTSIMWDGRETIAPLKDPHTFAANLITDLKHQAMDATLGHAQAAVAPTDEQQTQMAEFELALSSAQEVEEGAGKLNVGGADGGPAFLNRSEFFPGMNDVLGGDPTGAAFDPHVFNLYSKWATSGDPNRRSIARGEEIFNTHPLSITDVRGLNDVLSQPVIQGTCSTCHDAPNAGDHSLAAPLEIGTSRSAEFETNTDILAAVNHLSMPKMPVYEIVCHEGPDAGEVTYTSDPGKALLTGLCTDIGRGKGLTLRGLASRAPYFHNGAAAMLDEVVNFYDARFHMNLTPQEKRDLVNFLKAL